MNRRGPIRNRPSSGNLILASVLILLLPARSVFAWGREGHQIVALIAEHYMSGEARAKANDLLNGGTIDSIASWADDYRRDHPETWPWHYIDIPLADSKIDLSKECSNGDCVVVKTEQFVAVLRDSKADRTAKAEVLKYVVHFIGDLHQPLHDEDDNDKGGNSRASSSTADPTTCTGSGIPACWTTSTEIRKRSRRTWRAGSHPRTARNGEEAASKGGRWRGTGSHRALHTGISRTPIRLQLLRL